MLVHLKILIFSLLNLFAHGEFIVAPDAKQLPSLMKDFMKGFFNFYKLPFPTQVVSCYNDKGIEVFFDLLEVSYQLGQDLLEGETESYRPMIDAFEELFDDVTPFYLCQWQTDDWKGFMLQMNPNFTFPDQEAVYLQWMSKFTKLQTEGQLVEWSILLDETQQRLKIGDYYQAGFEYASAFSKSEVFWNEKMEEYLKFEAFDMGFIMAMGFSFDDSSISCYTTETAEPSIEWFYGLAKAITEADIEDITNKTEDFFKSTSSQIKISLPEKLEICLATVPGTKKFMEKFGLDPQVPVFPYALTYFSKKKPGPYYNMMTDIWEKFDDWDFMNAGIAFGDLLKKVIGDYAYRAR